jgi:hypothetical protein
MNLEEVFDIENWQAVSFENQAQQIEQKPKFPLIRLWRNSKQELSPLHLY